MNEKKILLTRYGFYVPKDEKIDLAKIRPESCVPYTDASLLINDSILRVEVVNFKRTDGYEAFIGLFISRMGEKPFGILMEPGP